MWSYRDWVIGAFNQNMPYDQFTIEQLAGDLLPTPHWINALPLASIVATSPPVKAAPSPKSMLCSSRRDRTETTCTVFLGLTAGCAVCHDHKFDQFTQREFYSMCAFFNNTTQNPMDGNVKDTPPIVQVLLKKIATKFLQSKPSWHSRTRLSRNFETNCASL